MYLIARQVAVYNFHFEFFKCELVLFVFAEALMPRFAEPIPNVTVSVGRDALLACVVDNLRGFKVNNHLSTFMIFSITFPSMSV